MANITVTLYWDMDLRKWTTTLGGTTETDPIQGLVQGDIVKFAVRFVQTGVAVVLAAPVFTASGIKADNDFTGSYLIQLSAPVLSDTTLYTFTVNPLNSANLNTFLQTYRNTWCALEIYDSVNGILTTPLELQITPGYSLSGTPTDNVAGVIVVAAGKTVTFPQSLTFPSALGTNGFQLTTDGAGALTWAASGALTDGDKGDITVSNSGATFTIDNDVVGLAQLAHMPTARVIGRTTAGNGSPELLTISGTGSVAMTNTPTLVTPVLGAATATSINGITISAGGSGTLTMAGSINTGAGGGSINTSYGGDINTSGDSTSVGGYIRTSGESTLSGGYIDTHASTANGGFIDTSGANGAGGYIDTHAGGGYIDTHGGGGSIDTTGNGSIGLGIAANRITLVGTTASNGKTATFPNVTGTVAVAATSATATQALFATATAGAPAYRAIATADIATALTTPGAIGGTTASTGAFTTVTLPVNSANYVPTLNLGGNKGLIAETNYVTVVNGSAYIVAFNSGGTIVNCNLVANPTNSKSCGTTGGRWSNVYSVLGDFSGAVTCSTTLSVTLTTTMTGRLTANGGITVVGGSYLLTTNSALTSNAGSGVGTLTNAPDSGNPTKWIAINDNGTERYIPTWELPPP